MNFDFLLLLRVIYSILSIATASTSMQKKVAIVTGSNKVTRIGFVPLLYFSFGNRERVLGWRLVKNCVQRVIELSLLAEMRKKV